MAITVVNKKQTAGISKTTLEITSATKGNILVAFIFQSGVGNPTGKDNLGTAGWSINGTHALAASSAQAVYVAVKTAAGGETKLEPTAGAGAIKGISYFELSGAGETVDTITHKDNIAAAVTATSESTTTTDAGDAILAAVGFAGAASGEVKAWTGTGPMTNVETGTTQCAGGSLIPAATESAVTFTANWTASVQTGVLVIALKPAGSVSGKATGALLLTGTAKGTAANVVSGKATGPLLLTGTAKGTAANVVAGKASGALLLTGTSKGATASVVVGQATGVLILTGTAHGTIPGGTKLLPSRFIVFYDDEE